MADDGAVMLYDGTCGFCAASVQFMLRHERRRTLRFATLQGATGVDIRRRHPEVEGADSMVWVQPAAPGRAQRVLVRSEAVIEAAAYLGGVWRVALLGRLLPLRVRDAMYNLVARHRHRILGNPSQCFLPPPEDRARFLDG